MKSSTAVNSAADRLKQWKSEKTLTTKETTKQMPGTKRPGSSSTTTTNGNNNNLKSSKSVASLKAKSSDLGILPPTVQTDTTTAIIEDVLDDVDGEYDIAYLQTILKQLLFLRYRMLIQHSKENQIAETNLLHGWKSVYDCEEEASALYTREQVALSIIQTHQQLQAMREQLEQVQEVVPRAHDTLSSIAAAGLALSHRYPLINVHTNMISSQIVDNSSSSRKSSSPGRSGGTISISETTPAVREIRQGSRSSSPNRGHGSSSSSSSSQLTETQLQELDETVAMRLHRLTQVRTYERYNDITLMLAILIHTNICTLFLTSS